MDPKELDERQAAAHEDAGSLKRAVPRITLLNGPLRHYASDDSRPTKGAGKPGEDRQVGVRPDAIKTPGRGAVTGPSRS